MILVRVCLKHFFALLACVCLFAFPAMAAPKPASISGVDFGYGNAMPSERWSPVHITITSSGGAFTGRIFVSYRQDLAQSHVIDVPASVGPGASVPIEVVLNMPGDPGEIEIVLTDSRGREIDAVKYGILSSGSSKNLIPIPYDSGDGLIACVGRISAVGPATSRWLGRSRDFYYYGAQPSSPAKDIETIRMQRAGRLRAVAIPPESLSSAWAAYDGLEAIVVRTEEVSLKVNEDARLAIQQWVQAGGRLVLQVDQVGEAWRSWLPPDIAAEISFGDLLRLNSPAEIDAALRRSVLADALPKKNNAQTAEQLIQTGQVAPDKEPTVANPAELGEKLTPAAQVPGRVIEISHSLLRRGWKYQWTSDGKSVIAHGPVGFGYVSIVGCDPAMAAAIPNTEATYRLWLDILRPPLADFLSCPDTFASSRRGVWGVSEISGANQYQRQAVVASMNLIADEPSRIFSPLAVIICVLSCILLLALVIGPFDAVFLKYKSKRQHSWLTAVGWIALMTLLAAFAPRVLRGNLDTLLLRDRVIDQIGNQNWTAGAFGYFASAPGTQVITYPSPGTFARGASAIEAYSRPQETIPPIRSSQGQIIANQTRIARTAPDMLQQGQWTFRTMLDESPGLVQEHITAELHITPAGAFVDLTLPKSDSSPELRSASIRFGSQSYPLLTQKDKEKAGHIHLSAAAPNLVNSQSETDWLSIWGTAGVSGAGSPFDLPGAQRRILAIETYVNSGAYALLTLVLADKQGDVQTDEPGARYNSIRNYRILVPIPAKAQSIEGATQ